MAKLYKVEMYILDADDGYCDLDDIINDCENNTEISFKCFNEEKVDIDWEDNIDINYTNSSIETYRKYFKK